MVLRKIHTFFVVHEKKSELSEPARKPELAHRLGPVVVLVSMRRSFHTP